MAAKKVTAQVAVVLFNHRPIAAFTKEAELCLWCQMNRVNFRFAEIWRGALNRVGGQHLMYDCNVDRLADAADSAQRREDAEKRAQEITDQEEQRRLDATALMDKGE